MTSINERELTCYQCGNSTFYLFADSRCSHCTRLTVEEVLGHETFTCLCCGEEFLSDSELEFHSHICQG